MRGRVKQVRVRVKQREKHDEDREMGDASRREK